MSREAPVRIRESWRVKLSPSTRLDFTLRGPEHLDDNFLRPIFEEISSALYDESGIEIPADSIAFDIFTNTRSQKAAQGKVGYVGPLRIRGSVPRIKLEDRKSVV